MERLIIDTSVLVRAERAPSRLEHIVGDQDDIAIAAITAAELLVGVTLAAGRFRAARAAYVDDILESIPVETYDLDVARVHAELLASARRTGRRRSAHDLIIAATAAAHGRTVVTLDAAGFDDLPGVLVRTPDKRV